MTIKRNGIRQILIRELKKQNIEVYEFVLNRRHQHLVFQYKGSKVDLSFGHTTLDMRAGLNARATLRRKLREIANDS